MSVKHNPSNIMVDLLQVTKAANTMAIVIFFNALFHLLDIQTTYIHIELKAMEGAEERFFFLLLKKKQTMKCLV